MPEEADVGHITIRDLDESVFETLRSRAELHGRSVEDEARDVLAQVVPKRLTAEEKLALFDEVRMKTRPGPHPLAEDLIRQDRDSR
ncbi:hypothetical protein TSO221_07750 [Azospirillum sp. TSO22-1]|nr:hypothetical protein TSO221_07750 [Azospirillum sp. TSO22-1]